MLKDKISKELFFEYLNGLRNNGKLISDVYEATHRALDLINFEDELTRPYHIIEKCFFTETELDYIYWYLFEKVEKRIYDAKTHAEIAYLGDDEALWEFLNRE